MTRAARHQRSRAVLFEFTPQGGTARHSTARRVVGLAAPHGKPGAALTSRGPMIRCRRRAPGQTRAARILLLRGRGAAAPPIRASPPDHLPCRCVGAGLGRRLQPPRGGMRDRAGAHASLGRNGFGDGDAATTTFSPTDRSHGGAVVAGTPRTTQRRRLPSSHCTNSLLSSASITGRRTIDVESRQTREDPRARRHRGASQNIVLMRPGGADALRAHPPVRSRRTTSARAERRTEALPRDTTSSFVCALESSLRAPFRVERRREFGRRQRPDERIDAVLSTTPRGSRRQWLHPLKSGGVRGQRSGTLVAVPTASTSVSGRGRQPATSAAATAARRLRLL